MLIHTMVLYTMDNEFHHDEQIENEDEQSVVNTYPFQANIQINNRSGKVVSIYILSQNQSVQLKNEESMRFKHKIKNDTFIRVYDDQGPRGTCPILQKHAFYHILENTIVSEEGSDIQYLHASHDSSDSEVGSIKCRENETGISHDLNCSNDASDLNDSSDSN